jgi:hypothetical protein
MREQKEKQQLQQHQQNPPNNQTMRPHQPAKKKKNPLHKTKKIQFPLLMYKYSFFQKGIKPMKKKSSQANHCAEPSLAARGRGGVHFVCISFFEQFFVNFLRVFHRFASCCTFHKTFTLTPTTELL